MGEKSARFCVLKQIVNLIFPIKPLSVYLQSLLTVLRCPGDNIVLGLISSEFRKVTRVNMDIRDKDQFNCWMQRAIESHRDGSHTDDNYIELYNILLR